MILAEAIARLVNVGLHRHLPAGYAMRGSLHPLRTRITKRILTHAIREYDGPPKFDRIRTLVDINYNEDCVVVIKKLTPNTSEEHSFQYNDPATTEDAIIQLVIDCLGLQHDPS